MQASSGLLILVAGLLVIYLGITGRYSCFTSLFACFSGASCSCGDTEKKAPSVVSPLLPLAPIFPQ